MTKNKNIEKILKLTKSPSSLDFLSDQTDSYIEKLLKVCQYLKGK